MVAYGDSNLYRNVGVLVESSKRKGRLIQELYVIWGDFGSFGKNGGKIPSRKRISRAEHSSLQGDDGMHEVDRGDPIP